MQFKCPSYVQDEFSSTFSFFLPILISIAFMFSAVISIGNIVVEKETKMREYLKLMGIKWYALWISWWIRLIVNYSLLSLVITIVTKISVSANTVASQLVSEKIILSKTNFFVIFLFLNAYSHQVSIFTLLLAQIFNKRKLDTHVFFKIFTINYANSIILTLILPFIAFSAKIGFLIIWILTLVNLINLIPSSVVKYVLCVFPNLSLMFGFQVIFQFERSSKYRKNKYFQSHLYTHSFIQQQQKLLKLGHELTLSQLFTSLFDDPQNLGSIIISMTIWCVFYLILTWYLEKILPGEYGVPLPFYFLFTVCYFFCFFVSKIFSIYSKNLS